MPYLLVEVAPEALSRKQVPNGTIQAMLGNGACGSGGASSASAQAGWDKDRQGPVTVTSDGDKAQKKTNHRFQLTVIYSGRFGIDIPAIKLIPQSKKQQ